MGSEALEDVGTILRSILTSEKDGIPIRKLEGEYRMLMGNCIPYRNLGFNTLEEYLASIPDTVRLQRNYGGETLVHMVVTESTAHVAQMVRAQKSAKPRAAARTAYRRPMSQHQSAYRPNRVLCKYSSSSATHRPMPSYSYKAAHSTTGDKRRPGYELYHPPAQRAAQPTFARQQPPSSAFGWPKKEQLPVFRNSDTARSENKPSNSNFSAFASGGFQRSSFEKPPRFLKAAQLSSSSSSISSLSTDEGGGARAQQQQQQGAVAAPVAATKAAASAAAAPLRTPSEQTGWRQLDSSWSRSTPAVTTPPAGASRAGQPAAAASGGGLSGGWNGGGGGGRGDTGTTATAQLWGAASKKPAAETQITAAGDTGWRDDGLATDGWGEPAQPIATSTAVKSLGWSDPSPVEPAQPLATLAAPVTPMEHKPVTIEPGQPRFDPFRSPTLASPKPAWMEPTQERFDPFRSPVPIGQLKLDLTTPAEAKLAGIEPGQQRFDPFKSTALPNATTFGSSFALATPVTGADAARTTEPRFDPFRQPLRLDAIIPSQPPKPVAKPELGVNLAMSSTSDTGLGVTPQPPAAASLQTPTAAPALQVATEFAPQFTTTFSPLQQAVSSTTPTTQSVEEPIPLTPNCQLVREYAEREGLPHSYTTRLHTHKRPHGAPPMWLAVLRLGDVKIPSFPNEMPTPDEAKEAAAACAVAKLRIEGKLSAHRVTPASNPEEIALLVTRVAQVVLSKPNGLVKEGVSAAYEERFYEQLPPYWLEHVAKSGMVHIDSGTQCILYPLEPEHLVQRERALSIDKDDRNSTASNSSGEPATDYVDIFVTCVTSTDNVCFRFVDYDDKYQDLLEAMALHYGCGDEAQVAGDLIEGHLYATLYDDAWMRVQLVARQGNGKAECYFVDEGNVLLLDEAALVHLEDEFAVLPMQAIQCQLDGLAQHAQCDGIADILSEVLLGKSLVAEVTRREEPIAVVVYDTWGSEDVDLNSEIYRRLMRVGLPEKGCVGKTLLGHVRADGVVWLQPSSSGMREMRDFEEALNNYCQTNPAMEEEPVMDTLYACQCRQDGRFYRAVLTSPNPLPSGEFEVLFVDFGEESRAFLAEFRNIDCLGNPVVSLPRQAVKCRLRGVTGADGITWSETATAKLLSLAGKGTELLVRVAEPASYMEPALVELFKRHEQSRDLVSINDTLAESLRRTPPPTALFGQH